jgi:hypothetical protein
MSNLPKASHRGDGLPRGEVERPLSAVRDAPAMPIDDLSLDRLWREIESYLAFWSIARRPA